MQVVARGSADFEQLTVQPHISLKRDHLLLRLHHRCRRRREYRDQQQEQRWRLHVDLPIGTPT